MFRAPGLFLAAWIAAVQYHLLNGAFLVPLHVYLCFVLAAGYRVAPAPAGEAAPTPARAAARQFPLAKVRA
jgi:hypothetical protein